MANNYPNTGDHEVDADMLKRLYCISHLVGERLGIPQEELEIIAGERDVCTTLISLLPLQNSTKCMSSWVVVAFLIT